MGTSTLGGQKYISLTTLRRSGAKVATPVWFVQRDGCIYVWAMATSGKVKRPRNNPEVSLAPCKLGGEPLGPYLEGVATISEDDSSEGLNKAFRTKYGLVFSLDKALTRLGGKKRIFVEIRLS
jgi:hypothetical protein